MALKSTVYKATMQVSDMDRNHYGSYALTIAKHPSETDERMMLRLLAFACNASETLEFGRGLSADDEPDLWEKDLTGAINLWIDVGLPDERIIRRACGRSNNVILYTYGGRGAEIWLTQNRTALAKQNNLTVINVPETVSKGLAALSQRSLDLQCTIQDGQIWFSGGEQTVQAELSTIHGPNSSQKR